MFLLLTILTACQSSPELVFIYPKVPEPAVIEKPIRPDWKFLTLPDYPEYVLLTVSDSDLLHDYIATMQGYGKLLQIDLRYYRLATDWIEE